MSRTVWRKGPPPSVGWWPASMARDIECLRWWNGVYWSEFCMAGNDEEDAEAAARVKNTETCEIEWTDRPADWPARSRT